MYAFVGQGFGICNQLRGHEDHFYNNVVVQTQDGDYAQGSCNDAPNAAKTVVYNNSVYTPTARVTECGMTLEQWQARGNDPGSSAHTLPSDAVLLGFARAALGLPAA